MLHLQNQFCLVFQFTASYEADPLAMRFATCLEIFQFTASYEADPIPMVTRTITVTFQFTASYEADQRARAIAIMWSDLSIHSLIRG